jgi:hypothetical protein
VTPGKTSSKKIVYEC